MIRLQSKIHKLKQLGYDVHMIFVNTSLDTALERNAKRERTVPEDVATRSWNAVQRNIGKFSQYFRQNFVVVDNNDADEDVMTPVFKQIQGSSQKRSKSYCETVGQTRDETQRYHQSTQGFLKFF